MSKITNELLYAELSHVRTNTEKIEKHLEAMNGKVVEHSISLAQLHTNQKGMMKWFSVIGTAFITGLTALFFKVFGGKSL